MHLIHIRLIIENLGKPPTDIFSVIVLQWITDSAWGVHIFFYIPGAIYSLTIISQQREATLTKDFTGLADIA